MKIDIKVYDMIKRDYTKLCSSSALKEVECIKISGSIDNTLYDFNILNKYDYIKDISIDNLELDDNNFTILHSLPKLSKITFKNVIFKMNDVNSFIKDSFMTLIFINSSNLKHYNLSDNYYVKVENSNCPNSINNVKTFDIIDINSKIECINTSNVEKILANKKLNEKEKIFLSNKSECIEFYKDHTDVMKIYRLFNDIYNDFNLDKNISQEVFDYLVNIGLNYVKPLEAILTLADHFNDTDLNYNLINDYLIDKDINILNKFKLNYKKHIDI